MDAAVPTAAASAGSDREVAEAGEDRPRPHFSFSDSRWDPDRREGRGVRSSLAESATLRPQTCLRPKPAGSSEALTPRSAPRSPQLSAYR